MNSKRRNWSAGCNPLSCVKLFYATYGSAETPIMQQFQAALAEWCERALSKAEKSTAPRSRLEVVARLQFSC
jgi:hypothetical protein